MADLVSKELRTKMLTAYFAGGATPTQLYLRLYKDEASINEATVLTDIAAHEQSGSGYAVLTLNPANWTVEEGTGGIQARLDDQTWTTTADDWGTLRWAVISTTADDTGDILLARDYSTGKTVTGVGANVTIDDLFFSMND
ncbi:hypothetical protein [Marinomonas atlantica]|uniref:hypothetical protein n=1 Tax=Marinomonas atlantica TaxID=1806668 RepID=UPI0008375F71|nr:hypothetical protein [Marinomonas atlantica]